MNPEWVVGVTAGIGLLANLLWALHNHAVGKRALEFEIKLLGHIDSLKGLADEKFAEERLCRARCGDIERRLDAAGA